MESAGKLLPDPGICLEFVLTHPNFDDQQRQADHRPPERHAKWKNSPSK
jgi:hypothetical protein